MLNVLRRNRDRLKWLLILVILALTVSIALLFVQSPTGLTGGPGAADVAVLAGESIRATEYQRVYRRLYDLYRDLYKLDEQPEIIQQLGLPQQALNQLIMGYAISYQATRMGLMVTDEELIEEIRTIPGLQIDGQFVGSQRYTRALQSIGTTPQEFEDQLRRDLLQQKLRSIITDGIQATESEVRQDFLERNQEVKLRYALLDTQVSPDTEVSEEELKAYYDNNQLKYEHFERRTLVFFQVPVDPASVTLTDDQINQELNLLTPAEQVRVRHLLVGSRDGDDNEDEARAKAERLLEQIQAGADFDEVARRNSDDGATAGVGGELGFIPRGQYLPEFERVAFGLEVGQLHDGVVKTAQGFEIIQTLARTTATRGGMRPMAEWKARVAAATRQAETRAAALVAEIRAGTTLEDVASANNLAVNTSAPITSSESIGRLPIGFDFKQKMFAEPAGTVLDPGALADSFVVGRIGDVTAGRIPPLDEIADQVRSDFISAQGKDLAQRRADDFFQQSLASSVAEAAREAGLETVETGFFQKAVNEIDENLLFSQEIKNRAFRMAVGDVSPPVVVREKYVVFEVAERSEVDETAYEAERDDLQSQLTEARRVEFFNEYVQHIIDALREQELISINTDLINRIAGVSS